MKTPKEYTKNLKNHIITEDMISDCLYSVNKRAKNFRDKAQEYRNSYYHGISQQDDMRRYYSYKEQLLSFFEPKCIHKQFVGYSRIRVYDYEDDYYNQNNRNIVWENCYYDHEEDREVWFYDYESKTKTYLYFLYYVIGERGFHTPIENPSKYTYPIEPIDDVFITEEEAFEFSKARKKHNEENKFFDSYSKIEIKHAISNRLLNTLRFTKYSLLELLKLVNIYRTENTPIKVSVIDYDGNEIAYSEIEKELERFY